MKRSKKRHAWEDDDSVCSAPSLKASSSTGTGSHEWESDSDGDDPVCRRSDVEAVESDDAEEVEPPAGEQFVSYLLDLLLARVIRANHFCIIMWLAAKAGIREAARLGKPPTSPSGHFQRHLKRKLGVFNNEDSLYSMCIPGTSPNGSKYVSLQVVPPHEPIQQDSETNRVFRCKLRESIEAKNLPPAYFEHPVVVATAPALVRPLGLFIDAVPYSLTDSVIGFWLTCLITDSRWCVVTLRRKCYVLAGVEGGVPCFVSFSSCSGLSTPWEMATFHPFAMTGLHSFAAMLLVQSLLV